MQVFNVIYTGLRKSIEEIVAQAEVVNADMIGLSILSGTHLILCQRMQEVLDERGIAIPWLVGGNIPHGDKGAIEGFGAVAAFPTGTKVDEVISFLKSFKWNEQSRKKRPMGTNLLMHRLMM